MRKWLLLVLLPLIIVLSSCSSSNDITDIKDVDVGYIEDNLAVIHLSGGESINQVNQEIAIVIFELHSNGKIITSISSLPWNSGANNNAKAIYIVYANVSNPNEEVK